MNSRKHHKHSYKFKERAHGRVVDRIYQDPELIKKEIGKFFYCEKETPIGPYLPDLTFLCETETNGFYKVVLVECKTTEYGISIRRGNQGLIRVMKKCLKEKGGLMKRYSQIIRRNNLPELKDLSFDYKFAVLNDFGGIEIINPLIWNNRR
jgi:hypothetical protein